MNETSPGRRRVVLMLALSVNALLVLYSALVTLQRFPNAGDEYACLISAQLFSEGRLSVASPEFPRFFDFNHVLNDGRFYGKYPPGWPLLLTPGVWVGVPWLVAPLFGLFGLFLIWTLAERHFSGRVAVYAVLPLIANPFFVFNSASYFAHASCLCFLALAAWGAFAWLDLPGDGKTAAIAGIGAGMAFLIRPFTALLILLPIGLAMLALGMKRRKEPGVLLGLLAAALPLLVALCVYLLYNKLLTGDPLLQPFTKYDPLDRPQWPASLGQWWTWFSTYPGARALELNWPWLPFCGVFLAAFWAVPSLRAERKARLLFYGALLLTFGYSFYPADGGIGYGPRYAYEALLAIALLTGLSCAKFPRIAPYAVALVLAVNVIVFVSYSRMTAGVIRQKRAVFELVEREKLQNAIVFLKSGGGVAVPGDLTRNGVRFDGPVLYVRDLGDENVHLRRAFPTRKAYRYTFTADLADRRLEPLGDLR